MTELWWMLMGQFGPFYGHDPPFHLFLRAFWFALTLQTADFAKVYSCLPIDDYWDGLQHPLRNKQVNNRGLNETFPVQYRCNTTALIFPVPEEGSGKYISSLLHWLKFSLPVSQWENQSGNIFLNSNASSKFSSTNPCWRPKYYEYNIFIWKGNWNKLPGTKLSFTAWWVIMEPTCSPSAPLHFISQQTNNTRASIPVLHLLKTWSGLDCIQSIV